MSPKGGRLFGTGLGGFFPNGAPQGSGGGGATTTERGDQAGREGRIPTPTSSGGNTSAPSLGEGQGRSPQRELPEKKQAKTSLGDSGTWRSKC